MSTKKILQVGSETNEATNGSGSRKGTKRITVDLPRNEHKFLRDFAYDADTDGMRVMRALLIELRDDPELSEKIVARLPELQ